MDPLKIIIAGDYPVFRIGMEWVIKKINGSFTVLHAENGMEVIELVKDHTVSFVFMDVSMHVMDGVETTCKLKKSNPDIKIIALSTMTEKYDVLKMFKSGANGYLLKNMSLEKIEMAFNTIIKGENYFSEEVRCFFSGKVCEKFKEYLDKSLRQELTEKEKEILLLICKQLSTREISEQTGLSEKTIEIHRGHIMAKTHSKNMIGLALYAIEKGFISSPALSKKEYF